MSLIKKIVIEDKTIEIRYLTPKYIEECSSLISESMTKGEPLEVHIGTTFEQYKTEFCDAYLQYSQPQGLSFIAIDTTNDTVVSVAINDDFNLYKKYRRPGYDHIHVTESMLDHIDSLYFDNIPVKDGQYFHYYLGATAKNMEGKGLGKIMRILAKQVAKDHGYKYLIVQSTNPITAHIWCKYVGGTVVVDFDPKDWVCKINDVNIKPFETLETRIALIKVDVDAQQQN